MDLIRPSIGFVLVFLFFGLLFLSNTYRLWFKTDQVYQDIYNSLTREPSIYPSKKFFLNRMENKERWGLWQKVFSILRMFGVLVADLLIVLAYIN
jgi:hypothetical protein